MEEYKISKKDWENIKDGFLKQKMNEKGYLISKKIMIPAWIIILLLFVYVGQLEGWNWQNWTVHCPESSITGCRNTFYECQRFDAICPSLELKSRVCTDDPGFCMMPLLEPGKTYGHKPSWLYNNFFLMMMIVLCIGYGLNHLLLNKPEQMKKRRIQRWK